MVVLTKDNFAKEAEEYNGTVVIDLYATWCAPCRMLAPVLAELEQELPAVKFCKVDVDAEPEIAAQFRVESIPMVAVVRNGTFEDLSVGYVPKETLAQMIRKYI